MGLSIQYISGEGKELYDEIVSTEKGNFITQSASWAMLGQRTGKQIHTFVVINEDKEVMGSCLLVQQGLPLGRCFLYAPKGPICNPEEEEVLDTILGEIDRIAKHVKAIYVRLEPGWVVYEEPSNDKVLEASCTYNYECKQDLLVSRGFTPAHTSYQPEHTLVLNLKKPLDQLQNEMKQKGRYNIKVAKKQGVEVSTSLDLTIDGKRFYKLLKETAKRDGYFVHPYIFYKNLLETLSLQGRIKLYLAHKGGELIAANIVTWYGDKAVYYYGASSNKHRKAMATYLLQWEAIKDAKEAGMHFYDFLGIAPRGNPHHPWRGITTFKEKFGGHRIQSLAAAERIYRSKWFAVMTAAKKLQKATRKLRGR